MRVSRMALSATDRDPSVERAAPPVLDRVGDRLDGSRFAQDAMVERLSLGARPVEELNRPIDGRAFFVAGDEETDGAFETPFGDEAHGGGGRGGDAALHVAGTATPELAV